jgi:hypothetical protein
MIVAAGSRSSYQSYRPQTGGNRRSRRRSCDSRWGQHLAPSASSPSTRSPRAARRTQDQTGMTAQCSSGGLNTTCGAIHDGRSKGAARAGVGATHANTDLRRVGESRQRHRKPKISTLNSLPDYFRGILRYHIICNYCNRRTWRCAEG